MCATNTKFYRRSKLKFAVITYKSKHDQLTICKNKLVPRRLMLPYIVIHPSYTV